MNALDIIKAMPLDDTQKRQIVNLYPFMEEEQKLSIDYLAWTTYDELFDERLTEHLGMQYDNIKKGTEHFGEDFYAKALKKTEEELDQEIRQGLDGFDLSAARHAMQQIINEINAAKLEKKEKKKTD